MKSITETLVGIDIGGTKIHFARIEEGNVVAEKRIPTNAHRPNEEITEDLVAGILEIADGKAVAVGIGIPGLVDMEEGVVRKTNNIPGWKDFAIRKELESRVKLPVGLGNDANCFALGERYFGKGQGCPNLVCLTLGSGVGAGIIVHDRLYEGNCMMAGEFGGVRYLTENFELYGSGKFFSTFHGKSALEFAKAASNGDVHALAVFEEYGDHIGWLIQSIIYSYGPETIILGGSLSKAYNYFRGAIERNLSGFAHPHVIENTQIKVSDDPHMPVLGAAALCLQ